MEMILVDIFYAVGECFYMKSATREIPAKMTAPTRTQVRKIALNMSLRLPGNFDGYFRIPGWGGRFDMASSLRLQPRVIFADPA
jgi:hypothetical protein